MAGSISVQVWTTDTRAYTEDTPSGPGGTLTAGGDVSVTANGDLSALLIAGALGASSSAGIGIANTTLVHNDTVEARIGDRNIVNSAGISGIEVSATSTEEIISVTASGGAASSVGIAVSPTINVLNETTRASVGRGATVNAQNGPAAGVPSLSVTASDETTIVSVAGSLAAGGTAGVGVGADVLSLIKNTSAYIDSGVTSHVDGDIDVGATSGEDITSVAAGAAFGGTAGVGVNAGVHVLTIATRAFIGDDPSDDDAMVPDTLSAGPGDVHAGGTVRIAADDRSELDKVVATLAIGGSAGVGAAATVTVVNKTTEAFIGAGASVTGDGQTAGLGAATGAYGVTYVADPEPVSVSFNPADSGVVDTSANTIDVSDADGLQTGDVVTYRKGTTSGNTAVGGLEDGHNYFVHVDGSEVSFYDAKDAAMGGDPGDRIHLTGTGSGPDHTLEKVEILEAQDVNGQSASSLKSSGEVGSPDVQSVDTSSDEHDGTTVDPKSTGQRTLTADQSTVRGVAIAATNRDDIETYSAAIGGGTVGVAVAAAVNVINTDTNAYIGEGASVNEDQSQADGHQSVTVAAVNDFHHVALAAGAGFGAVGVAPGVDVTVLSGNTTAAIGTGSTVNAMDDVLVTANASEDILLVGMGIAAGTVGVGGGVSVLTVSNTTYASISGTVFAGGDVLVNATDDTSIIVVSGALGAGFVGVGASVGVMVINKDTQAFVADDAIVDARGDHSGAGEAGVTGVLAGTLTGGDDATGFDTATRSGLIVQAESSEDIVNIVVAAGAGFVGVSGAVGVAIIDSDTQAWIGADAQINQTDGNSGAGSDQGVYVNAANEARVLTFTGAIAGGFVGVGGAVTVGNLNNDVNAKVRSGSKVKARKNVEVNALSIKKIDTFDVSGAGGFVGVAGAVSVWSIGDSSAPSYSDTKDDGTPDKTANSLERERVTFDAGDVDTSAESIDVGDTAWPQDRREGHLPQGRRHQFRRRQPGRRARLLRQSRRQPRHAVRDAGAGAGRGHGWPHQFDGRRYGQRPRLDPDRGRRCRAAGRERLRQGERGSQRVRRRGHSGSARGRHEQQRRAARGHHQERRRLAVRQRAVRRGRDGQARRSGAP